MTFIPVPDSCYPTAMQTITKLDAARRQINGAIRMWLGEGDLTCVLTLAWAGLTILRDLTKAAGIPKHPSLPSPWEFDREAANFLKHADRDPDGWLLEIDPIVPEFVFHEAMRLYQDLSQRLTSEMEVARKVIDLQNGFCLPYDERAERRREEERCLDDLDEDEREKEERDLALQRRARQSAYMAIGRQMLTGESLFPEAVVSSNLIARSNDFLQSGQEKTRRSPCG